jgi:hypothetical protein
MDEANQHQAHGVVDVTIVKPSAQRQRRCNSPQEKTALSRLKQSGRARHNVKL